MRSRLISITINTNIAGTDMVKWILGFIAYWVLLEIVFHYIFNAKYDEEDYPPGTVETREESNK